MPKKSPSELFPGLPQRATGAVEIEALASHVKSLPRDRKARVFTEIVGLVEIENDLFVADLKHVNGADALACAQLAGLVQTLDHPLARTHMVFLFPGLPPR